MGDIPFKHELTAWSKKDPVWMRYETTITGFCYDSGLCAGRSAPIFFRAGHNPETIEKVKREHKILSELQDYDFVPRIISLREINQYCILFTECIHGVSLDTIPMSDPRWKIGIMGLMEILYTLYIEKSFVHNDLDPNNIMVDNNNKVYIIDFECSSLDKFNPWTKELMILNQSISTNDDLLFEQIEAFDNELESINTKSMDPSLYKFYMNKFQNMLFPTNV